ncbi:PqqD family protein [Raineyella sp. W15-4]|uniref:PqqD family protein n=1 Tax=Raineyella sp. W15-4 TaxID=3081651 RepID=UPI0029535F1F|nr:PqqD family protein [Raineyella sp. W15-4]WOQ16347.1 PqqD family protein [Raineyella sp. W15-4]
MHRPVVPAVAGPTTTPDTRPTTAATPPTAGACSLTLHGLACRVPVRLLGERAEELRTSLTAAWSRCLTPDGCLTQDGNPTQDDGALVTDPIAVRLGSALPAPDQAPDAGPGADVVQVDGHRLDAVLQHTTQAVTRALIAAQTGRLLMFHAGACADPATGATVAYVASSGTGKTTLSRVLGRTLGYLTDETVGITADGSVLPYPKPLSIRQDGTAAPKRESSPDDLHLLPAPADPWLRRIVLLHRTDTHSGPPTVEPLELPEAVIALAPESSALSSLDHPLQLLSELLAGTGPVLRCTYREAAQLVPVLTSLAEEPLPTSDRPPRRGGTEPPSAPTRHTPAPPRRSHDAGHRSPGTDPLRACDGGLLRVEPEDSLTLADGLLLLYQHTVVRLSDVGRAIVALCDQPRTDAEIAGRLAAEFGHPPQGSIEDAARDAVDMLVSGGILRRTGPGTCR